MEIINDNPDVTFTVTGTAFEPVFIHSASITPAQLMSSSWTNTDLIQGVIPKTWAINPHNGALGKIGNHAGSHEDTPEYRALMQGIRFNFDVKNVVDQTTYSLPTESRLLDTVPFPNGCETQPTWIRGNPGVWNYGDHGNQSNDLYGNKYLMCKPNTFTKLDGNTGATLWSIPLPVYTPESEEAIGGHYPQYRSLSFSADNALGVFELYYSDGNEPYYNGNTYIAWSAGYIAFDVLTGASWTVDKAGFDSIRGVTYIPIYNYDEYGNQLPFPYMQPVYPTYPSYKGQLFNASYTPPSNMILKFDIKAYSGVPAGLFGMAFRMQNHLTMYRMESSLSAISLVKINNGSKTVLKDIPRSMLGDQWYSYTVKLAGGHIKIYENGGLVIDVTDNDFPTGGVGPFSEVENTEFRNVQYQWADAASSFETPSAAIVNTNVEYEKTYVDPENDAPLTAGTQWSYEQITETRATADPLKLSAKLVAATRFIDYGDGKSGYIAPYLTAGPVLTFEKVGVYKIDYRVPDNPHRDNSFFAAYSKFADWYTQYLVVHRRPLASFTLIPQSNGVLTWSDSSYDPDRCYAYENCPGWAAGAAISASGIVAEKYYYVEPDGTIVQGKLTNPTQPGSYTVAKAVQDEYRAWSDWSEQTYIVCPTCTAAPNNPPAANLTFPAGSFTSPTAVSLVPTISWSQSDPDVSTLFSVFDLEIKDAAGNCYECVTNRIMNTFAGAWAWTMDTPLQMGQKYQVRVRVSDGPSWSAWTELGWMATNSPPTAVMTFPSGTQAAPTIISSLRPTFTWLQTDLDVGTVFDYFQLQVTNEANNVMIVDSGKVWQGTSSLEGSWAAVTDLPAGQKLRVRVIVWDQYGSSSEWSPQTWLYINRPPVAIMIDPNGTQASPTVAVTSTPVLSWKQSDPDPDGSFHYFQIQITNEANDSMVLDSGKLWQGSSSAIGSWTVASDLPAGQKLRVRVKVWDEFAAESDWSAQTWLYRNRAPHADFTWLPKPAFEGDTVTLNSLSSDPDGDALTFHWGIEGPGYSSGQDTEQATIPASVTDHHPGDYIVTLTVTDTYGASDQVTKPLQIGDLRVEGFVNHTLQWDLNRKAYNRLKSGEDERPRLAHMFWSGEAFVLAAITNEPAAQVQARMSYTELQTQLASVDNNAWNAQMFQADFERLPDSEYVFQFTAIWSNGHTETAARTVIVNNPWTDFSSSVRKE